MSNQKISQMTPITTLEGDELLLVASNNRNYHITAQHFSESLAGVVATKESIGLGDVDNTSDADKPVSVATLAALDEKANLLHTHKVEDVENLNIILDTKANADHTHSIETIENLEATLIQKAGVIHTHSAADVSDLNSILTTKADAVHVHAIANVTGLETLLNAKADIQHSHEIENVNGLQTALNGKAPNTHIHASSDISDLNTLLSEKANTIHNHGIDSVTGLQDVLDAKVEEGHTHQLADLPSADLLNVIKSVTWPQVSLICGATSTNSINSSYTIDALNGYNINAANIITDIHLAFDDTLVASVSSVYTGTPSAYTAQFTELAAGTEYLIRVRISDEPYGELVNYTLREQSISTPVA